MKTIWKFQTNDASGRVVIPGGAKVLKVGFQLQRDEIKERNVMQFCIWALVETENVRVNRFFGLLPTGEEWPDNYKYIDTIIKDPADSGLVYHAFEVMI